MGFSDISNLYQGFDNLQANSENLHGAAHKGVRCKLTLVFGLHKVHDCKLT
jgi:hypothetical protein